MEDHGLKNCMRAACAVLILSVLLTIPARGQDTISQYLSSSPFGDDEVLALEREVALSAEQRGVIDQLFRDGSARIQLLRNRWYREATMDPHANDPGSK